MARPEGRSGGWRAASLRLALGMVVFGSATPVSKIVTEAVPPFIGAALRVALGALVLLPFAAVRWASVRAMGRADWLRTGVIALAGMFGFTVLLLYGMRATSGVAGAVVMATAPAVTATGSVLFLGDGWNARRAAAIALAVGGVLVLHLAGGLAEPGTGGGGQGGTSPWLGALLVFGAVLCEACYTLLGKRVSEDVDPLVVAFLASALALPLFAPFAAWQADRFEPAAVPAGTWVAVAWYGAGTLALGSWLWYTGLAQARGAVAAGFMGLMPVSALALSYWLLDEPFRWIHPAGFAIVFAGVILVSWDHARGHAG